MAKKQAYYAQAEKMYVEEKATLSRIYAVLGVSEKTLREWKKEGDWDHKRIQYLKLQNSCNVEMHKMVMNLMQKVNDDIAAGITPEAGILYTIKSLTTTLARMKQYEDSIIRQESPAEQGEKTSVEEIVSRVNDILGIR
jgi:hypothetical protein